jgi:hypothetical protein
MSPMIGLASTVLGMDISMPSAIALMVIGGGLVAIFILRYVNQWWRTKQPGAAREDEINEADNPTRLDEAPAGWPDGEHRLTPAERHERRKQQEGLTRDLQAMAVEIEALAKRLTAQVEEQALRLEKLIGEAEDAIARLEQVEAQARQAVPLTAKEQGIAAEMLAEATAPRTGAAVGLEAAKPLPVVTVGVSAPRPYEPDDPLARNVYQLADSGLKPLEIARRLDEHVGKVELILALREV